MAHPETNLARSTPAIDPFNQLVNIFSSIADSGTSQGKIYINLNSHAEIALTDKKSKTTHLAQLAEKIEKIVALAINSDDFSKVDSAQLETVNQGLDKLHKQIEKADRSRSMPSKIISAILKAFGCETKYKAAQEKIKQASETLEKLKHSHTELQNQTDPLIDLEKIHTENMMRIVIGLMEQQAIPKKEQPQNHEEKALRENLQLNRECQNLEAEIESLDHEIEDSYLLQHTNPSSNNFQTLKNSLEMINNDIGTLTRKKQKINNKIKPVKNNGTFSNTVHLIKKNMSHVVSHIGKKSKTETLNDLQQKIVELEKNKLITEAKLRHTLAEVQPSDSPHIAEKKKLRNELTEKLTTHKHAIEKNNLAINLPKVKPIISPNLSKSHFKIPSKTANDLRATLLLRFDPQGKYAPESVAYQRKVMFGFSVGQRSEIFNFLQTEAFFKQTDIAKLQESVEGDWSSSHMIYTSQYLETLIPEAIAKKKSLKYINGLVQLQADLQRSLALAIMCDSHQSFTTNVATPNDIYNEMMKQINAMQPGARLLIPTGFKGHATMLVLEKNKEGEVIPTFYNTGAGLQRMMRTNEHKLKVEQEYDLNLQRAKNSEKVKENYYAKAPISTQFKPLNVADESFKSLITEIITASKEEKEQETERIHKAFEDRGDFGTPGPARKIQMNGVCSFQSQSAVYKDILGRENYLDYKIDLLTHMDADFQELLRMEEPKANKDEAATILYQFDKKMAEDNLAAIERLKAKKQALFPVVQ